MAMPDLGRLQSSMNIRLSPALLTQNLPSYENAPTLKLDVVVRRHVHLVLDLNRGSKLKTARQLGISRSTLYRMLDGESSSFR